MLTNVFTSYHYVTKYEFTNICYVIAVYPGVIRVMGNCRRIPVEPHSFLHCDDTQYTEDQYLDTNFVVAGGIAHPPCRKWRQIWHNDNSRISEKCIGI